MLGKYLAGECSSQEQQEVEVWLQVKENAQEFEVLKAMWEGADPEPVLVDVDSAWGKVENHIQVENQEAVKATTRPFLRFLPYLAAGIAILVVSFMFFFPNSEAGPLITNFKNTESTAYKLQLPDGSDVTLKPGSSVQYAQDFGNDSRSLELKGEAFFDVKPDPTKPFTINVEGTEVKVLGTSFNVNPTEGVEVKVATGKVKLSAPKVGSKKPESVVLEAGMAAKYDKKVSEITEVRKVDDNEFFWVKKKLSYRETPLETVAKDLRKYYKVKIRFGLADLKECQLTTTFENESIDSIMLVIQNTFNLTVTQDGNKYLLEGIGC